VIFDGNYFRNPALLAFIAENPIRRGTLPPNIVSVAKVILEAGARTEQATLDGALELVCSGRVPRECRVQLPSINLLCDSGGDPNRAMQAALAHGEFHAVDRLIQRGAVIDPPVSVATGQTEVSRQSLAASAGEDPNRYNPVGHHSHSTPLHQAALAGHLETERLLVDRGARTDLKDTLLQGTPAGWANYAGKTEIERYLHLRDMPAS
jgi:hypothetical protein